ncbi:unnamed protein product [Staurois parvus]|uniref:Uncharacterized protein n=1 Tax=Staurois parvus TaxID=386267 RepID=A0ABN9DQ17_9NEOB|nr:unnamed protein product [Staurois parvus]
MTKTAPWDQECDLSSCYVENPYFLSALLFALPDKTGTQEWKNKVTDIFEGVSGVQEWLNKSEEFWEGFIDQEIGYKKTEIS